MNKTSIRVLVALIIMAGFLALGISKVDMGEARLALAGVEWWSMSIVFVLYLATHVARSYRLQSLLAVPVSFPRLFSVNAIGFMAINVIPLRLGEAVRPYLLKEQDKVELGVSVAAIVVERLFDFSMLLFMLLLVGFAVDLPSHNIDIGSRSVDLIALGQRGAGVMLVLGIVAVSAALSMGDRVTGWFSRFSGVGRFVSDVLVGFQQAFARLRAEPTRGLNAFVCTVLVWVTTIVAVKVALYSFGLPHGWNVALVAWTFTLTGMTFVPTPGFFGSYEACCAGALVLLGVASISQAMAFALVLHLGQFLYLSVVGVIFLVKEGISLGGVVRNSLA
jgi:uncharacterized protein (TIRG00374 family)